MVYGTLRRWGGPAAIAGGLLWVVLRPLVSTSWDRPILGLAYEDYNRLMVAPLLLLSLGALGLHVGFRAQIPGWAQKALLATALGLALMLFGVVVKFYVAGGVKTGDRAGSVIGWSLYLLGYAATIFGLVVCGIAALRGALPGRWGALTLAMGVVGLLWLPVGAISNPLGIVVEMVFGLGWVLLGFALWSSRGSAVRVAGR